MSRNDFKNIVPSITESRLSRQYAAIRERVPAAPRPRRSWAAWTVAATCAAALAVVAVRSYGPHPPGLIDNAIVESGPADGAHATSVVLADGSHVDLGAATRARLTSALAKAIRIDLERGQVEIEATHLDGRTFVVGAGGYEVHVVGTHFVVRRDPGDQVSVRVDRGVVEVTAAGGGEAKRLAAGEQWSGRDGAGTLAALSGSSPSPAEPPSSAVADVQDNAPEAAAGEPAAGTSPAGAFGRHEPSAKDLSGAKELLDEAQRARADGRSADAARAYDRLRRTYPHDRRAALAALELGRLRLDVLGDPRGAEEALRSAIALGASSPLREDAEARRIEALARMGDQDGCAAARAAYLARWPNGTYRHSVELGCGSR